MPIRINEIKRPQAEEVLDILKRMFNVAVADGNIIVLNYENGREHGYHVSYWPKGSVKDNKAVSFSENRNSDDIVVYPGHDLDFSEDSHVPNEAAYKNVKYFKYKDYASASQFIFDYLLDLNQTKG